MPVLICLRKELWTGLISVGDQVPTCPVFTRAKIKFRLGILVNFHVTPADFTSVGYLTPDYHYSHCKRRKFWVYIFTYTLSATGVFISREELYIYTYVAGGNSPLECSTYWEEHIHCHPQTDRFVVSKLFSEARHARCFTLGSKYRPIRIMIRVFANDPGDQGSIPDESYLKIYKDGTGSFFAYISAL